MFESEFKKITNAASEIGQEMLDGLSSIAEKALFPLKGKKEAREQESLAKQQQTKDAADRVFLSASLRHITKQGMGATKQPDVKKA